VFAVDETNIYTINARKKPSKLTVKQYVLPKCTINARKKHSKLTVKQYVLPKCTITYQDRQANR